MALLAVLIWFGYVARLEGREGVFYLPMVITTCLLEDWGNSPSIAYTDGCVQLFDDAIHFISPFLFCYVLNTLQYLHMYIVW
jgi:hypothetical protein